MSMLQVQVSNGSVVIYKGMRSSLHRKLAYFQSECWSIEINIVSADRQSLLGVLSDRNFFSALPAYLSD